MPSATGPFAIDLSSRRVREASRLLEGVRQGQPLGALLGYRVERLLHETVVDNGRSMDRFIAPLRRVAPLVARAGATPPGPVDTIAAENVVDGLVLHRRWKEERNTVIAEVTTAGLGTSDLSVISSILDRLADAIDGLSDALTAEAAYQMVRGNTSRTASTLAAIAQGDAPPPELEVTRTPRSGTSLTHRLLLLMSGPNVNTPGWVSAASRVRSNAEPMLNFWAFKLLGDGSRIRCTIERLDDETGAVLETRKLPLSELGIAPLDLVYGVEAANTTAQPGTTLTEIEQQVLYHARRKTGGFDPLATLRLQHARPADLAPNELTLFDVLEQARACGGCSALPAARIPKTSIRPSAPDKASSTSSSWMRGRAGRERAQRRAQGAAEPHRENHDDDHCRNAPDRDAEARRLRRSVRRSRSASPVKTPRPKAALAQQGQALLQAQRSAARSGSGAAHRSRRPADQRGRRAQLAARMRAVFGTAFVVLPRFTFDAAGATEFTSALGGEHRRAGRRPAGRKYLVRAVRAGQRWRVAHGRVPAARRSARRGSAAQSQRRAAAVRERRALGRPAAGCRAPSCRRASCRSSCTPSARSTPRSSPPACWWTNGSRSCPTRSETTALAFQFDTPDACAPQSVLIAVPPVPGQDWTAETLRRVLMETLDLAKLRAVDTASLGAAAQHLPGLYLAFNTEDHAVSTDFAAVTR